MTEIDPSKYHIEGFHEPDGDFYWLAANFPDRAAARLAFRAARRRAKENGGIDDGQAIVGPNNQGILSAQADYYKRKHAAGHVILQF